MPVYSPAPVDPGEEAKMRKTRCLAILGLLLLAAAGVVWWQRTTIMASYVVRQLCSANEEDRTPWIERVVELDTAAVPGLLDSLARTDDRACANAIAGL